MSGPMILTRDEWRVLHELTQPCGDETVSDDEAHILHQLLDRELVDVKQEDHRDAFQITKEGQRALRYGLVRGELSAEQERAYCERWAEVLGP